MTHPSQTPEMLVSQPAPVMDQVAFGELPELAAPYAVHETQVFIPVIAQEHQTNSGLDPEALIPFVAIAGLAAFGVSRHRARQRKKAEAQTIASPEGTAQTTPRNYWAPPKAELENQPHKPVELKPLADDDPTMGF